MKFKEWFLFSEESLPLETCLKHKLSNKIFAEVFYEAFSKTYDFHPPSIETILDGLINHTCDELLAGIAMFIQKLDSTKDEVLQDKLRELQIIVGAIKHISKYIESISYIHMVREDIKSFHTFDTMYGTSFMDCLYPYLITEEQKRCIIDIILVSLSTIHIGKLKKFAYDQGYAYSKDLKKMQTKDVVKLIWDEMNYNNRLINLLEEKYCLRKPVLNLMESIDAISQRYLDINFTHTISLCLAGAGEVDWRPTETVPEDYFAL